MTPQERQLIDDLFDRLAKLENSPRDNEAMSAIVQGLRTAPNAVYTLVQTALVQDEALKRAHDRIQELEAAVAQPQGGQQQSGGFLDSMRDAVFGQSQSHGSVPPVRAPDMANRDPGSRPVWNSGQVMRDAQGGGYGQGGYGQGGYGQAQPYGQSYGAPQQPPFGGGGGSFLGTAAAAAAGVVGGGLLLSSIRGMMGGGGSHQSLADAGGLGGGTRPWGGDQSSSDLARDAGINDINSSGRDNDSSRAGLVDQASNNSNDDNNYADNDQDSDGYDDDDGFDDGGDNGSDYA
ncbi:ABC transporter substrate-binding protein [Bradyrhizobium macuxiense]|uniref:ABC transporter substrate-binding protein n=1 Tax=Bradyrhizobium macuxiense TaxID=1755647 RepID=A0A125QA17_9BRAD|nr:DUF2076 domain-containing protein [Bradyrhizobium macuxiense]KWV59092.1 ABC transporter substrate-binding protein [Bradyrhizobium macuxiense]